MAPSRSIAVLGPGGVGGFVAALLAKAGERVVVLAGEATAAAIGERGLRLESRQFGDLHVSVATATRLREPVDACLVTVKATQLDAAVERVPVDALGDGLLVPSLNGVDHADHLRAVYSPARVAPAAIRIEVMRVEPGVIRHTTPFSPIEIATSKVTGERVAELAARLRACGVTVRVREDEAAMLWDKLAFLAPLALLTTHERGPIGAVRTKRRPEMLALIAEVSAVARAAGANIDPNTMIERFDAMPETMSSSMQRDDAAGLPLELDAIGGAILRHGSRVGIATPVAERLVGELAERESNRSARAG